MKLNEIIFLEFIKKTKRGYQVNSKKGKNLSSDDLTHDEAVKRLRQIEYFKRH